MTHKQFSQFGDIIQLAFVPRDIGAAIRFWTETMGAGPFFKFSDIQYERFIYQEQSQTIDLTIYIGYWGTMQIELIQQHDDTPSSYKKWLDSGREGLHHVCIRVDDMAAVRAHCIHTGAKIEQEFFMPGVEAIYVDIDAASGTIFEFASPSPELLGAFEYMQSSTQNWDRSDPVRSIGGTP